MKKVLYAAVMALTMGFLASCNNGPSTGMKYGEDENPQINYQDGTVNGKTYDNETAKCWELTLSATYPYVGMVTETSHDWCTECVIVATGEEFVAESNHGGISAGYSYKEAAGASDYESCHALDEDDED